MRKVSVKLASQRDLVTLDTGATTYGELKAELYTAKGVSLDKMRVIERETKVTFEASDAVLPEGDFILFAVPEKMKSGS